MNPASAGGVQTHLHMFKDHVERRGGRIRLLSPFSLPRPLIYPVVGTSRLVKAVSPAMAVWWRETAHSRLLRRLLRGRLSSRSRTVLYAQDTLAAKAALAVRRLGRPVEVVLVVHFNISPAEEWVGRNEIRRGGWLYRQSERITREVISQVDRLIVPSEFMLEQVRKQYPEAAEVATWRVPNFVVPTREVPLPGVSGDLITIGSLEPRKNQLFLLEVLRAARDLGHRYRLTIAGDGPSRPELERQVDQHALRDQVTFLGFVPRAARLLPTHRVYAHASRMENLPIALIESLAAGRPILAAPVGGIPEVFSHEVEGHFWDLDDPRAAALILIRLLEDQEGYAAMCSAALARFQASFSAERTAAELYDAVLGVSVRKAPADRTSLPPGEPRLRLGTS